MNNEYIIINKTAIQKRIEELENDLKDEPNPFLNTSYQSELDVLKKILSQSISLIPEIEKAIEFGKDIRREKSFINNNYGSPFVDYEDSTEETINYISNLKLDI
jgi:hypothetical protein